LEGDETLLAEKLWERINPSNWPFSLEDLPKGSVLVGGAVRDGILGRLHEGLDLDVVVPSGAIELTRHLAIKHDATCVVLDLKRDIARMIIGNWNIDISSFFGVTLEEDLLRRDFSLNAIALTLGETQTIIDPSNGLRDLRLKNLVAISEKNLIDDPLRILRAFRFKAELNVQIGSQTLDWIASHHNRLQLVSPERIQSEITKILIAPWADESILLLREYGLLDSWLQKGKRFDKELNNAKNFTREELSLAAPLSRLTSLLSDEGLEYLRFSKRQRSICRLIRKWQLLNDGVGFSTLNESQRLQLHKDLESHLPAIILEIPKPDQTTWLRRWRDLEDPLFHPSFPVDGNVLKQIFHLPSGPKLGQLLDYLSHEKAFGRLPNEDQVFQAAKDWLQRNDTSM